jgi:hypothetical protein
MGGVTLVAIEREGKGLVWEPLGENPAALKQVE